MAEAAEAPLVLVTGASGFIATHLIKQLLAQQKYRVRGTVRSTKNEEKVKELKALGPADSPYPLELVEADLTKEEGWKEAVEGCTFVHHVASPYPMASPRNEDELIIPAVNGTLNVLKACAEAGTVKRVVVTSSVAAVNMINDSHETTEDDWQPEENSIAYTKSKIRAERAAWDFVEKLEDGKKFELAVVNPAFVVGPFLTHTNSGSFDIIKAIITKGMPALPEVKFGFIDVRDVAAAHIAAVEIPEAAGHRHILVERPLWMKELGAIISQEFTPQGYNVATSTLPKVIAWPLKFFSADIKAVWPSWGKDITFNTSRMRDVLKIDPLDVTKGIIESCYSLIELGFVAKTPGYKGPPDSRKPEEPESTTEAQGSKTEDPKTEEPKPKTETDEPKTETQESKTVSEEPKTETETEEPKTETEEPKTETEEPETEEPKTETEEPKTETEKPKTETEEPKTETEEPKTETEESKTETEEPKTETEESKTEAEESRPEEEA